MGVTGNDGDLIGIVESQVCIYEHQDVGNSFR